VKRRQSNFVGLIRTRLISALIDGKSASVAGRREYSANYARRNQNDERRDEPVYQKRIQERARAPGHPTEGKSAEDRRQGFDLRFADVCHGEWHRLQPECFRSELARVPEKYPAAEKEFPTDQIEECTPGLADYIRSVIVGHAGVAFAQVPDDRRHQQDARKRYDKPGFPVAQGQAILARVFTENEKDDDKRNEEVKYDAVEMFLRR